MKKLLLFFIVVGSFGLGFMVNIPPPPIVIEKEIRVFDFANLTLRDAEIMANFLGKTLNSLEDIERKELQIWKAGYKVGFLK